jgi:hypothetical protein
MESTVNDNRPLSEAEILALSTSLSKVGLDQRIGDDILEPVMGIEADYGGDDDYPGAFNPKWRFYVEFSSLSAITLMVALDATSQGNALPVSWLLLLCCFRKVQYTG